MKYNNQQRIVKIRETTEKLSEIPWIKIAGLRYRLVHHYEDTN